jgi:radical SAM superfamily enzyme YgiQ (UPF0313 family)
MKRKRHESSLISCGESEWGGRLPVALVFPHKPALAYSSLGWQVVYQILRNEPTVAVEPVFWDPDQGRILRSGGKRGLDAFGLVAFSLTYEFDYLHLFRVLLAAGIEPTAFQRPSWPLVIAGGALTFLNPAPIIPSVDLVWVGEAEAGLAECVNVLAEIYIRNGAREQALEEAASLPGVFVPGLKPRLPVRRAVDTRVLDKAGSLAAPAVSCFASADAVFGDSLLLEVNRGCPHGCRFCAAGFMYRPHRQASLEALQQAVQREKPRKVGLVGTALTDWPQLLLFLEWLREQNVDVSLSSLRAEGLTEELLDTLRGLGIRTVTLALEGASKGLRNAMNKHLCEEAFLRTVERLAAKGFKHLKIYLLTGWLGETDEDWLEFGGFLQEIDAARRAGRGKTKRGLGLITLGLGCLVPKPWTPLQWAPMASEHALKERIASVRRLVKPFSGVQVRPDSPRLARLQGLLARGDERVHALIRLAAERQATGRQVREAQAWSCALQGWSADPAWYLDRERGREEAFPWEMVALGVDREYLWREWTKVRTRQKTPPCPTAKAQFTSGQSACKDCRRCGLDKWLGE